MTGRIPKAALTLVAAAVCLLLAACGLAQQASTSHPAARARASHAVSAARSNPAVQADVNAASACAASALKPGSRHPVLVFRACMTRAFPKGGSLQLAGCAGQAFALDYLQGKAAVLAGITACGRRYR